MKKRNMNKKVLLQVLMIGLLFLGIGSKSYAQFLVSENFRSKEVGNNIVLGTGYNNHKAYLTAATKKNGNFIDNDNEGWLRLTEAEGDRSGYAFIDEAFPSGRGVFIDFEYKTWGGNNADGISVFLFDGTIDRTTFRVGGYGGSLSYAPRDLGNNRGIKGLKGGYLGLGIDEYGNFATTSEGKQGNQNRTPNQFTLRGHTVENATSGANTNKMLKTVSSGTRIDYGTSTRTRPSDSQYYRRVQIEMNKNTTTGKYDVAVRWATTVGGQFTDIFTYSYDQVPPALFKLGFGASTGGNTNYHEIRNLFATTPGGVVVQKTVDKTMANVGEDLTYTIDIKGQNVETLRFKLNDDLAAISEFFEVTSITASNNGHTGTSINIPRNSTTLNNVDVTLSRLATATITIKGKVKKAQQNGLLENTATIVKSSLPTKIQDLVSDDQLTSTVSSQVIDPNFCGCPEGAIELENSNTSQVLTRGKVYCVTGEVSINNDLKIEQGATLYVQSNAKLKINGTYTQSGGVVSICPRGGIELTGSAKLGAGATGDVKIIMKENSYFTITESLEQFEPTNGKVNIEMYDSSVVEVCKTYKQNTTTYPVVTYAGKGEAKSYFIVKAQASGGQGSKLTTSDQVNVIAMNSVTTLQMGPSYCGPNAKASTCSFWPAGLTDAVAGVKCKQAEGLIDFTKPVGPDFCEYDGDKFISGYHSTIIKTATGFQIFGEQTKPSGKSFEHFLVPTDISFANGFHYKGSPLMATMSSQYYAKNQFFLLTTGGLYGWGTKITDYKLKNADLQNDTDYTAFTELELPEGVRTEDIKYMTASYGGLALLLTNGKIMVTGSKSALYGDNYWNADKKWHTVSTAQNTPLSNVVMMKLHNSGGFAYTSTGKYYAWGSKIYNGTAAVTNSTQSLAVEVQAPFAGEPKMIGITGVGEDNKVSYFALSNDGKVYSIGDNSRGQLGIGDTTPEQVNWQTVKGTDGAELLDIKYISAQDNSTYEAAAAAINKFGRVYFWGSNGYQMLGQPQAIGFVRAATEPQGLGNNRAVYVEVGGHTGMIVNDDDRYCYVGHKVYGSMGDGIAAEDMIHTFDCETTGNVIDMCGKIVIIPEPGLALEKVGTYVDKDNNGLVNVGDEIHYTFSLKNTGNISLTNVKVTDPKITIVGNPIVLAENEVRTDAFSGVYVLTQEDIDRGGVFNLANADGKDSNNVPVHTVSIDPNPIAPTDPEYPLPDPEHTNCSTCTVTILPQSPKIVLVKTGIFNDEVDGDHGNGVINYTFVVKNTGNVTLKEVELTDVLFGANYKVNYTDTNGALAIGESWTITATYNVTDEDINAEKVTNQAKVVGKSPKEKAVEANSGTEINNSNPTITPVEGGGPLITNPHIYHKVQ
ncbi:hypothetical protein [Myroides sp. DF42-4-2]|uniref:DUF7507 domain-containing protein n=1 Tax=unclassified Myroides TaxID=2642485 RepID=UPI0025767793|nr:hypothetical protein [Myroides sp. DF42-4-2]MDM1408744.1 hypothetical protein [Myroides sp. DF42-4-2]